MNGATLSSGIFRVKRGEVWWVAFDPSVGGEIRKTRPALIISHDLFNQSANRLQVVPLSSNIATMYPSETLIILKGQPSKALADQIATVSKLRIKQCIARVTDKEMQAVESIVCLQLGLTG